MQFKHGDIIRLPEKREVLFEKYSKKNFFNNFFNEMFNGCEVKEVAYLRTFFFIKNSEYMFELYIFFSIANNHNFYCREDSFWNVLIHDFDFKENEIQYLTKNKIENIYPNLNIDALIASEVRIKNSYFV